MPGTITNRTIYGGSTTGGAGEFPIALSIDGAPGVVEVLVPAGSKLVIADILPVHNGGLSFIMWRLQQADNGVAFYDIGLYPVRGVTNTSIYSPKPGIVVNGDQGPDVRFRARVVTPAATVVAITLRGYTEN